MAIIRNKEMRSMGDSALSEKLDELRKQLMKVNTQISTGTIPENPGRIREIKKTIARIIMLKESRHKEKKLQNPASNGKPEAAKQKAARKPITEEKKKQ